MIMHRFIFEPPLVSSVDAWSNGIGFPWQLEILYRERSP